MKKININIEDLTKFYIDGNNSINSTAEYFNVSRDTILRILKENNIKKNNSDIRKCIENTCLDKYGYTTNLKSDNTKEKIKQTCLTKYGYEYSHRNKAVIEKTKATNIAKYGKSTILQTDDVINKVKTSNIEKYGVENPFMNKDVQDSIQEKNKAKHDKRFIDDMEALGNNIDNKKDYIIDLINKGYKTIEDISDNSIYSYSYTENLIKKYNLYDMISLKPNYSKYETEIINKLKSFGINNIKTNDRNILDGKEIDIYLPDYKVGIEFNGNYWHSELKKEKNYHKDKTNLAESKGIFIFHIFEYEWMTKSDKIINMLINILHKNKETIYARKCVIKEVSASEKKIFLENNHLQGNDKSNYNIGLYYNDKLVSLMTFCKPRFNKKYTYELSRFCSLANTNVIGGASKLFKYFLDNHKNCSIISYSNRSKTTGNLYSILGFTKKYDSVPNYVWVKSREYKTRYQSQMKDENKIMHDNGYVKLYDCGQRVWEYK